MIKLSHNYIVLVLVFCKYSNYNILVGIAMFIICWKCQIFAVITINYKTTKGLTLNVLFYLFPDFLFYSYIIIGSSDV